MSEVKGSELGTDKTNKKAPVLHDNKNSDSTFKSPQPVPGVKAKNNRTLTDSSDTDSSTKSSSTKRRGTSVGDLTTSSEKPKADLKKTNTDKSAGTEINKAPDKFSTTPNPDLTDEMSE